MAVYIQSVVVLKTHKTVFICFLFFAEQTAIIPCTAITDWSLQRECECYCDTRTECFTEFTINICHVAVTVLKQHCHVLTRESHWHIRVKLNLCSLSLRMLESKHTSTHS